MYLSEIPGYTRAIERVERLEDARRDYAFLDLDYELNIAGSVPRRENSPATGYKLSVRPLTLRMFTQLCAVRSPFFVGGRIQPEDVAAILWRLSAQYSASDRKARAAFVSSIATLPFHATTRAINRYLDLMMFDRPPSSAANRKSAAPDTSFAASMAGMMKPRWTFRCRDCFNCCARFSASTIQRWGIRIRCGRKSTRNS